MDLSPSHRFESSSSPSVQSRVPSQMLLAGIFVMAFSPHENVSQAKG